MLLFYRVPLEGSILKSYENGHTYILESWSDGTQEGETEKSETNSEASLRSYYNSSGEKGGDPELK